MRQLLAYSGTATKIRAMHSHLFTNEEYEELAHLSTVSDALGYISRHPGYRDIFRGHDESSLHRGEIERMLTDSIYITFQKIYRFASVYQREFLSMYFPRYELVVLKSCMRSIFNERTFDLDLSIFQEFFEHHSKLKISDLASCRNMDEMIHFLKGSAYYDCLLKVSDKRSSTLWDYEMALDLFYFTDFWKKKDQLLKGSTLKIVAEAYGTKMDLLNIDWIYRSKYLYRMSEPEIYAILIPVNYHLKKDDIKRLVESSESKDFEEALSKTYYGIHYPGYQVPSMESMYSIIRHKVQRDNVRRNPYSVAVIISYLFEKEHEVDRLTTALECIRYGISPDETLHYIIY
ncbi:MAG: V-type ATPase subunit [Lachnospiraceae bacterium]|nr:V-type ATPase subunit [Lachnospiraceae bacterium]